ncbi:class I mannose-6-phosphate isomerase [Enterococcus faecium]|nr:class I mannose-6-phosphate isomerase [Enterococcus faecium]
MTLTEVLQEHPEFLGTHPQTKGELPILIKFIDAKKDLSVQVHPTDEYAIEKENGQLGKTEMWYVLDASLIYGLQKITEEAVIREAIAQGTVERYLQKVPVKKNDVFFIEAGTIHAIGAGALIAEIQENSNLTYRLYDYDRVDKNGKKRTSCRQSAGSSELERVVRTETAASCSKISCWCSCGIALQMQAFRGLSYDCQH